MIYAIRCTESDRVKIGYTKEGDARKRLRAFQVGCPSALEVAATLPDASRELESYLHELLYAAESWIRGEWFRNDCFVRDVVEIMRDGEYVPHTELGKKFFGAVAEEFGRGLVTA